MQKEFFRAVCNLLGLTIGAGILSLPYLFNRAGFLTGLVVLLIAGIVMLVVSLYLAEITLRTKGKHQLSGLAEIYLGKKGKIFMFLANALSIYGALSAYTIGSGQALAAVFGCSSLAFSVIFFISLSFVIYLSISFMEKFEAVVNPVK